MQGVHPLVPRGARLMGPARIDSISIRGVIHRARKSGLTFWLIEELPDLRPGDHIECKGIIYRVLDCRRSFFCTKVTVDEVS